jgi:hypothetical protein
MANKEITGLMPFLNCEPLDVNMASPFSGLAIVDYVDARFVVLKDHGRLEDGKIKFTKDGAEVATDFATLDGGEEFGFGRACGNNRLCFDAEGDGSTGHNKSVTSSRTLSAKVIGMRCINNGEGFHETSRLWIEG